MSGPSALAGVQDGDSHNFLAIIAQDDVVGKLAIRDVDGLFKVDVEHISLFVVRRPQTAPG